MGSRLQHGGRELLKDDELAALPASSGYRSGERRPWWAITGLAAIALLALGLYTWSLSRNGMGNSYYAAAVKSATVSWKAFFFGSLDPGSFITVDKPPAAFWVMALSARLFGFSSWSLLLPQALAGAGSVLILHRLVRRWVGNVAALLAALAFALTPVAVLIFRFNNPDAFLTLLLLLAAWAVWSATETGSTWKIAAAGVAVGFGFLTKMLEAFMVLPAFALVYLLCGPPRLGRRLLQMLVAAATLAVSAGWWVAIVELWPTAGRPYVGGTTTNSLLDLIFSRSGGYFGTAAQTANLSGSPGWLRIFNNILGGQISWFIPLALVGLAAGLWVTHRAPRTDKKRTGYLLWGLWTLVMIAVFSSAPGTFHSYYTVVLAPGIAALAGAGSVELWRLGRSHRSLAWVLTAAVAGAAVWSAVLLNRASGYLPWLVLVVIVVGVVGALFLTLVPALPSKGAIRRIAAYTAVGACTAALCAGPLGYAIATVERSVTGNQPAAGPSSAASRSGSVNGSTTSTAAEDLGVDQALISYLKEHQGDAKYLVAVQASSASVPIILATGEPVVTIGGYKSRDPVPTLEQLASMVEAGELRYVLLTGATTSGSGASARTGESSGSVGSTLQSIIQWVGQQGTLVPSTEYQAPSTEGRLYYLPGANADTKAGSS